ncbi:MAG: ADP-ribosylglycohydrolase family protein [Clostridiales bacterium]|nr:ADP-ribosylglycohydrolase family protein [Clostridiales bacterium]
MQEAYPVPLRDSQEMNWNYYVESGNISDEKLFRDWISQVPGSLSPSHLVVAAIQCMRNRGYDVREAEKYIDTGLQAAKKRDGAMLQRITAKIYYLLNTAPKDEKADYWKYRIYTNWEEIRANSTFPEIGKRESGADAPQISGGVAVDVFSDDFEDRVRAGWTAQLIGGALGTQVEGYNTDNIEKVYGKITFYLRPPETFNDDITYEIAFLDAFREHGYEVTSEQIAEKWLELIADGYSAEEVALRNLRLGIRPPESGTHLNYYSDWIGVQMRTMIHGMSAPGNPALAAELAVRDGVISHSNSGLLGGIFNAVLVSMAFVTQDVRELLVRAADYIPKDSEFYQVLDFALRQCREKENWREAWRQCEKKYEDYNWIHVYPNAAAEIIALWYGNGDFDETASIICMEGKDADCTAAPVLNILGVMYGTKILTPKWTEPLGTTIHTIMRKYRKISLQALCEETIENVRRARQTFP